MILSFYIIVYNGVQRNILLESQTYSNVEKQR